MCSKRMTVVSHFVFVCLTLAEGTGQQHNLTHRQVLSFLEEDCPPQEIKAARAEGVRKTIAKLTRP